MADKAVESGEKKKSKSTYQKDRKILGRKKERRKKKAKMNNPATRTAGCQERMLDMELFFLFFFSFPSVLIAFSCFISHRDKQVLGSLLEGSLRPVWPGPASSGSLSLNSRPRRRRLRLAAITISKQLFGRQRSHVIFAAAPPFLCNSQGIMQ